MAKGKDIKRTPSKKESLLVVEENSVYIPGPEAEQALIDTAVPPLIVPPSP